MTKFDRYDRATDALDDAAQSLRLGLIQLRRLPERGRAEEVGALSIWVGIVLSVAVTVAIGQTPTSVKIGNQTWTKQNLHVETADSWCYEDKEYNCARYGRLYTYEAAKKACASMGGKWRLPTRDDWDNLLRAVGGVKKVEDGEVVFEIVGKKLKSKRGWSESGNGTDDYGFSAMPGGLRGSDGSFGGGG